jgi:hypothetical protein
MNKLSHTSTNISKLGCRTDSLQASPLFKIGGTPIFALNDEQKMLLLSTFQKMIAEQNSGYFFKDDLIRTILT